MRNWQFFSMFKHVSLPKICGISLTLGLVIGNSIYYHSKLSLYFILVSIFHLNEFIVTSKYLKSTVTDDLFLIWGNKGSKEYWMMQLLTIVEFVFSRINHKIPFGMVISSLGILILLSGILLRYLAIQTLGDSFSHYINQQDQSVHELVVEGIFNYIRHPSYLGFYLYVIGIEVYLKNIGCFILSVIILTRFFRVRIRFEEFYLVKQYGRRYRDYQDRVKVYIPFI